VETIWGAGQGIGTLMPVGPAHAIVARMAQEYAAAGVRLAAEFRD
jgi:nitronate monooxygenase